jgi:small-conductance mechanosensitive channel
VTIPNALMANQKIVNESGGRWLKSRLAVRVGVAYGTDVHRVLFLLEEIARRSSRVARDPVPAARVVTLGGSSVDCELSVWIEHPSLRGTVAHELYLDMYDTLAREGIEVPIPQREVWVKTVGEDGEPGTAGVGSSSAHDGMKEALGLPAP